MSILIDSLKLEKEWVFLLTRQREDYYRREHYTIIEDKLGQAQESESNWFFFLKDLTAAMFFTVILSVGGNPCLVHFENPDALIK